MKANMNNMHMHMDPYMHSAFWFPDQITVTFQYPPLQIPTIPAQPVVKAPEEHASAEEGKADQRGKPDTDFLPIPTFKKEDALKSLNVERLNAFLTDPEQTHPYPALEPIDFTDTLRFPGDTAPDNPDHVGKYLFTSRDEDGNYVPTVISFFKFDPGKVPASNAGSSSAKASSHGNGSMDNGQDRNNEGHERGDIHPAVRLVKHINSNLDILKSAVPIVSASLTWVIGGSPFAPVGCPLIPPIPVPARLHCSSSPGLFPITLPELPTELERMTGDSVHVLILDTLPRQGDIKRALEGAEDHNLLLLDVANNVVMHHNQLPAVIDEPNPLQPKTGKDIKGRNGGGFRMADHGLFIAGLVRDIAPDARVECIRALNDFCAGDSKAFVKALERIHNRMLLVNPDDHNKQGDLYRKQVIINLSLVVPPDDILKEQGVADPDTLRKELFKPIKSLVNQGALFVASAGNEGDARYQPANPDDVRPEALYPAAFAYHGPGNTVGLGNSMIPVGAVDKHGKPSSYSCYPGDLGIATYAGDVPKQFKQDKTGCFTEAEDIDALIGIYSSLSYPALLLEDCRPAYPTPNAHAWAYWLGTSFATPIISGLVARMLQYRLENPGALVPPDISLPQALMNVAATRQITWDRLDTSFTSKPGQMLLAVQQCASRDSDDDDDDNEKRERVNIHVTINE